MKKYKVYIKIVILTLISVALVYPLILPTEIGLTSISDINEYKEEILVTNSNILAKEREVQSKIEELEMKEEDKERIELKAKEKIREINPKDLEFHLPSILIGLEGEAVRNNLEIEIKQKDMTVNNKEESGPLDTSFGQPQRRRNDDDEDSKDNEDIKDEPNDDRQDNKDEPVKIEMNNEPKLEDSPEEASKEQTPKKTKLLDVKIIEGLKITDIPITLKGDFVGVREFIHYLDKINYIEPAEISITSNGESTIANIRLLSYHK